MSGLNMDSLLKEYNTLSSRIVIVSELIAKHAPPKMLIDNHLSYILIKRLHNLTDLSLKEAFIAVKHYESVMRKGKKLQKLINETSTVSNTDQSWKQRYEWLCDIIRTEYENAESFLEDMKEYGLTASSIEAEGYLRCARVMLNTVGLINVSLPISDL
jgi:hypothetical protein